MVTILHTYWVVQVDNSNGLHSGGIFITSLSLPGKKKKLFNQTKINHSLMRHYIGQPIHQDKTDGITES